MTNILIYIFIFSIGLSLGLLVTGIPAGIFFKKRVNSSSIETNRIEKLELSITLILLLMISIGTWAFYSWASIQAKTLPGSYWELLSNISETLFGVATAGLLGGIVFEFFLRKDILTETRTTLAEIVTSEKNIVKELFDKAKRNRIIETMLQVNLDNDAYGSALYNGFVAYYSEYVGKNNLEFRFEFNDHITISDIDSKKCPQFNRYYEVVDQISFKAKCSDYFDKDEFVVACATNEIDLEKYFQSKNCIYRWLLKDEKLNSLVNADAKITFSAIIKINGLDCKVNSSGFDSENKNYEIRFAKPKILFENAQNIDDLMEFELEIHTLQPKRIQFISIHLAYPVKGADLSLDYENVKAIKDITHIWFGTRGKNKLKRENPVLLFNSTSKIHKQKRIKMPSEYWLFPDSGVVFIW